MTRPSQIALIWLIYVAGVLLGLSRPGGAAEPWPLAVVAGLITGAAMAAHLVNEAEDAATDRLTLRTRYSGGSGALEASGLRPAVPLWLGLGLSAAVAAATWIGWLASVLPGAVVTLLLVGLVGALAYSLPPPAAMHHGWGEPLNAILGGLILPLAGVAVAAGAIGLADVLAFLPLTLAVLASVMATAWPDRAADASTGKGTMQVRLRPSTLRRVHTGVSAGFVLAVVLAAATGAAPFALAGLLVVPALVVGTVGYTRRDSPRPNVAAMVGLALVLVVAHGLGLAGGPMA
ncbi:MAG: UbiA family prenyltransferase [Candidatus Limnocylindrales bacterium]